LIHRKFAGRLPTLAGALMLWIGCAPQVDITTLEPEPAYRYLQNKYEAGDYLAAVDGLDFFTLNYSGSALVDSAQYLLGMSHFKLKEYLLAAEAFNELVRRFPRSPIAPEAMYQAGASYYQLSPAYSLDQEYTTKAISALQAFIDYYPEQASRVRDAQNLIDECRAKLAHKEFSSGIIYIKMKDYVSAEVYLKSVIEQYYDSPWAADATYWLGYAQEMDERPEESAASYTQFLTKFPNHSLRLKAEAALVRLSDRASKTK
jgi:outer membrane protein assembly factor BamD